MSERGDSIKREIRADLRRRAVENRLAWTDQVRIVGILNDHAEKRIRDALAEVWGCSTLKVEFNSPGGLLRVGEAIANDLKELAGCGVRIQAHALHDCASAALRPFLTGHERTCTRNARFTFHQAALRDEYVGRLTPQAMRRLAGEIESADERYLANLASRGVSLPDPWIAQFRAGQDVVLSADSAYKIGLVHLLCHS
jgi:ATP-dependent protease ClpP protease subunit